MLITLSIGRPPSANCFPPAPEVPCERVVSYAKSAWADAQGSQSAVARCSVVKRVATINQHAEEHIHPIMAEFGLSLPIPITIISGNLFAEGIPRLKPIDFLH